VTVTHSKDTHVKIPCFKIMLDYAVCSLPTYFHVDNSSILWQDWTSFSTGHPHYSCYPSEFSLPVHGKTSWRRSLGGWYLEIRTDSAFSAMISFDVWRIHCLFAYPLFYRLVAISGIEGLGHRVECCNWECTVLVWGQATQANSAPSSRMSPRAIVQPLLFEVLLRDTFFICFFWTPFISHAAKPSYCLF
jgi:hypothetical protein